MFNSVPSNAFGQSWAQWIMLVLVFAFALYLVHTVAGTLPR